MVPLCRRGAVARPGGHDASALCSYRQRTLSWRRPPDRMQPGPCSAPAITSEASRPAGICFSAWSITRLATSHSRRQWACVALRVSCPAKASANWLTGSSVGVSGTRAGPVARFPRGNSCPRLFIRDWTARTTGSPRAAGLGRCGGQGYQLLEHGGPGRLAAEPVPGEVAVVVAAPGGDQAQIGRESAEPGPFRLVVIRVVHFQAGQPRLRPTRRSPRRGCVSLGRCTRVGEWRSDVARTTSCSTGSASGHSK
jgi:hypothetical protein